MKKQNNLLVPVSVLLVCAAIACGCEFKNEPKDEQLKIVQHDEEYVQKVNKGRIADTYEGSVYRDTVTTIDSLRVKVQYGSPGVRKRVIWGRLVPYDTVWVSGAILATAIELSKDVSVGGKDLKAGKYAFFTIPGRKGWKIVINTDYEQHNTSNYDPKKDLLRLDVVPDTLAKPVQRLTYGISKGTDNDIKITMAWEKLSIPLVVKITGKGSPQ